MFSLKMLTTMLVYQLFIILVESKEKTFHIYMNLQFLFFLMI